MPSRYYKNKSGYLKDKKTKKFVHREAARKKYGYLHPGFHHVHHKDGNKLNNNPRNLERMYNTEHRLHHDIKRKEKKFKKI